jgi:hypothetical protein
MRTVLKVLKGELRILTTHCEQPTGTKISEVYSRLSANIIQFSSSQNMTMLYFLLAQHSLNMPFNFLQYSTHTHTKLHSKLYAAFFLRYVQLHCFIIHIMQKNWNEQPSMDCIFQKCSPPALYDNITHNSAPVSHTRTDEMRTMSTNSPWQAMLLLSCTEGHDKTVSTCYLTMK